MTECNSLIIYKNQLAVITEVSDKISIKYQTSPKTATGKSATYSTQKIREKDMTLLYPANLIKEKKQLQNLNKTESIIEHLLEIAENENITRQAVRDIIKKGERKLFEYEEKLLFMKKTINQEQKIQQILLNLTKIQKDSSDKQVNSILEGIKKELNCLV